MPSWETELLFQVFAQARARSLFDTLDPHLAPELYIVALQPAHGGTRGAGGQAIRVEILPESPGVDEAELGVQLAALATPQSIDPDITDAVLPAIGGPAPGAVPRASSPHALLSDRAHHDAVRAVVSAALARAGHTRPGVFPAGKSVFLSPAAARGDALLFAVLEVDRAALDSHPSLNRALWDSYPLCVASLLDGTIYEFLQECARGLERARAETAAFSLRRDPGELLRAAGKLLMNVPVLAALGLADMHRMVQSAEEIGALGNLYEACNVISSMRYEGEESAGAMTIARPGHPAIEPVLSLVTRTELRNFRAVRKLLEVATKDLALLSDSRSVAGYGRTRSDYASAAEDMFEVHFVKHHCWQLVHAGTALVQVTYGEPQLPHPPFHRGQFLRELTALFGIVDAAERERLWDIVSVAARQRKGTMVVITSGAREESGRLENQCTRIEPVVPTPGLMRQLTAIDGAVILDPHGRCHAVGAILDGAASRDENPARGARYNSAVRYTRSTPYAELAIVVSEDGTVDLIRNPGEKLGLDTEETSPVIPTLIL